jgi:polyisoprenoid-binding protein YceI
MLQHNPPEETHLIKIRIIAVFLGTVFMISGCGGGQPTEAPPPQPETNATATEEIAPTAAPTSVEEEVAPTATPAPVSEDEAGDDTESPVQAEEATAAMTENEATDADTPPAENVEAATEEASQETATQSAEDIRMFVIVADETQASYIVAEEFFGGALDRLGIQPGLVDAIGVTQEVTGEMTLDFNNLAQPVVSSQFSVDLRALTSDQPRRDNRIREANLESNRFPFATFTISSIENGPAAYTEGEEVTFQASGDITIREITLPATFDVTAALNGDIITGVARVPLKMTDFGFNPPNFANTFSVEDEFVAEVLFTFQQES